MRSSDWSSDVCSSDLDEDGALDRFEGFASEHGPRFYGLPLNEGTIGFERGETRIPERIGEIVPFHAGETLGWRLISDGTTLRRWRVENCGFPRHGPLRANGP